MISDLVSFGSGIALKLNLLKVVFPPFHPSQKNILKDLP